MAKRKLKKAPRGAVVAGGFQLKNIPITETLPRGQSGRPIFKEWSTDTAIREGFKSSTWVYACVKRIADAAASAVWKAQERQGGLWRDRPGHPLEQLIERPNPHMSRQDLIARWTAHLYLGGNAVTSKVSAGRTEPPVELWPLDVGAIRPVPSRSKFIESYRFERGQTRLSIPADTVVHDMFVDPANPYWGMAPIMAMARVVDTDVEAVKFNKFALQNRAVSDGAWVFKQPLSRSQWEEARQQIREQQSGPDNARNPWVLGSDARWESITMSPVDLDFIDGRKLTREEICAGHGVPPPLVGIYDKANLNNIKEARRIFWFDTVIPYLLGLQQTLNRALSPEFGDDVRLVYDISHIDVIVQAITERAEAAETYWKMGVPFNKLTRHLQLGIEPIPGGDEGFVQAGVMPVSALVDNALPGGGSAGATGTDSEGEEAESQLARLRALQGGRSSDY